MSEASLNRSIDLKPMYTAGGCKVNRVDPWRAIVIVVIVACIPCGLYARAERGEERSPRERPNIIVVFADDQGYQDLGCYGSPHIKTPNIDSLAAEGIRFTSFYSAYCVCSASRASLMTGCYQPRLSMPGVLGPTSKVGLHPDEVTIADMLKSRGYATMCVGKWHLGHHPQTLPTAQGFDRYFGLPYSNDMARLKGWGNGPDDLDKIWKLKKWDIYQNALYRDTDIIESPLNQVTMTERYTEQAVQFIRQNSKKPFFLYFPHTMVHVPLFVSDDRYEADPASAYRLACEHVDWSVGRLLKTLRELGISDDTLVVYTSDNGPWLSKKHHGGSALPLRAGKGTTYEGGMRVPGIIRWPKRIPAGTESDEVVGTIDLLPTFAALVGADLPDHPIDGLDVSALLLDPRQPSPHREVGYFYYKNGKVEAVRRGPWKLRPLGKEIELYDLDADIGESTNLASSHPQVVRQLQELIARYDADLQANKRPVWRMAGDTEK
jgi:arylsulfatase A